MCGSPVPSSAVGVAWAGERRGRGRVPESIGGAIGGERGRGGFGELRGRGRESGQARHEGDQSEN